MKLIAAVAAVRGERIPRQALGVDANQGGGFRARIPRDERDGLLAGFRVAKTVDREFPEARGEFGAWYVVELHRWQDYSAAAFSLPFPFSSLAPRRLSSYPSPFLPFSSPLAGLNSLPIISRIAIWAPSPSRKPTLMMRV